jgi:formylglycine-generating enzyme required for sulfatase activity
VSRKRITVLVSLLLVLIIITAAAIVAYRFIGTDHIEQLHYDRDETELVVVNIVNAKLTLFQAGKQLNGIREISEFAAERIWLTKGNYFLQAEHSGGIFFYPVPIQGYRAGTEKDDSFSVTIRAVPEAPPSQLDGTYAFIPAGHFLFGDRLNPYEPHLVWVQAFFIARFEVTNAEFRQFLGARDGYADDTNWSDAGKQWKKRSQSGSSASLSPDDAEYERFGQDDHPVTQVNWFEAAAYCRWLTQRFGGGRWLYSLPTEAEWEKAARGPDNFDYPLAQNLSDAETALYNWRKNPLAEKTVIGTGETLTRFVANRYGVYHLGGNVVEWTQGLYRPFNREKPYAMEDGRNREDVDGVRVVRGGSWYSASTALMYIPYRDTFQPEISHNDLGFRIVVRSLMH